MSMEMDKKKTHRKNTDRAVLLLVSLVLVLSAAIGGTLGYLTNQKTVTNTMQVGEFSTDIDEKLDHGVKSNVTVENTGEYDAYIRAVVVVTWQNQDGDVYPETPDEGTDYTIEYGTNWELKDDGFWYYKGVVGADGETSNLIDTCKPIGKAPEDGYDLNVEILASAIQADPQQAVQEAWKMQYDDATKTWKSVVSAN